MSARRSPAPSVADALKRWSQSFGVRFDGLLTAGDDLSPRLMEAMRYSALAGGKRLRPYLLTRCCEVCGGSADDAFPAAAAIECVHAFSLVHDDLPAMDNDDLRRGRPTNHKQFGEAAAILAGDGLLALAFELVTRCPVEPSRVVAVVAELARGTGWLGMIGGQMADIDGQSQAPSRELSEYIHERKTAALFQSACRIGAIVAGAADESQVAVGSFGRCLGHAFQIADDLLDVTSTSEQMGKGVGKDAKAGKQTFPAVWGVDESVEVARRAAERAVESLSPFGPEADDLRALASYVIQRHH
ncbi:MAG: polyprenyl synthetase family protein [Phycisphaerales bacterium]|nr:polyprenyl synthetase family protein [Phycisphaerales bacterium]